MSLTPGTTLGPYEILSPLGAGGMGEVYRARDTRLDRDVAVKILPDRLARDTVASGRFEREAKVVAALSHPHILAVYDVGKQGEIAYVVTELLEGETLRQALTEGSISTRRAIEIAISVADGLAAAHARGIVHRDLKPENIFITRDGVVKILDFGLARMETEGSSQTDSAHTPTVTLNTVPGTIIGTINYMSPEQIRAQKIDARSDVFSFGCVLYEMLSGERAFQGETSADTMTAILRESPRSLRSSRRTVGFELERVIDRCLEKKPEARFQSSHDLAFTLRSILADSGSRTYGAIPVAKRSRKSLTGLLAAVIVVGGTFVILSKSRWASDSNHVPAPIPASPVGGSTDSIQKKTMLAVLPFENLSRDPDQEFFSDGLTEEMITQLGRVNPQKLGVIARSSAMHYKNTDHSITHVKEELGVDYVVEGSVRRAGSRVRISATLIQCSDQSQRWANTFERESEDVLSLQSEVAQAIAREIKVTLTPQEQARMVEARPVNAAAHEAYLKGRFYWNKFTPDGLQKAIENYEQAIAIDPKWPLGYAGLAEAYTVMPHFASTRPSEAIPKSRTAAAKALELDPSLGEAHDSLAWIATTYDWDWTAAKREFEQAIFLNPNYATAHLRYALYYQYTGHHDEAIKEMTKAQELDPLAPINGAASAEVYYISGDLTRAESGLRKTLEFSPDFAFGHNCLAKTLVLQGRIAEAMSEAEQAVKLSNNAPRFAATLGFVLAKAGRIDEARRILGDFQSKSANEYVNPTHFVMIYAGLNDNDAAFELLEKAYRERDVLLPLTLNDPFLASMRSDRRFAELVHRLGLNSVTVPATISNSKSASDTIRLAVLPFANDSGDSELDYLGDGIAETLINRFSRLDGLSTVPRSKAFSQRGATDPAAAGRALGATAVLTGRVLKRADNLTVQVELTEVAESRQLWGERYQRKVSDLVDIERMIAGEITDALRLRLTGEEKKSLSRGYSQDAEAYRLYLQGRFWWTKRTKEGFDNAMRLLGESVRLDPTFALAYSGISDTYALLPLYGLMAPKDAAIHARAAADKALQLDDGLAEAHTSMGMVRFYIDWDFESADKEFRRAEQLNPRYATAQQWWGLCLGVRGRFAEASVKLRRAVELDPLMPILTHNVAWIQSWQHDWPSTLTMVKAGLDFAPDFPWLQQLMGLSQLALGQNDEALKSLRRAVEIAGSAPFANSYLAYGLGRTGHKTECEAMINEWLDNSKKRYVPPADIAIMYLGIDNHEEALAWLEKGFEQRDVWMTFIAVLPFWDPLRDDPRFVSLLQRIGLPDLRNPAGNPEAKKESR